MKLTCPKDKDHKTFEAVERNVQTIQVDEEGNYTDTFGDSEVLDTNYDNSKCLTCGEKAEVE